MPSGSVGPPTANTKAIAAMTFFTSGTNSGSAATRSGAAVAALQGNGFAAGKDGDSEAGAG